MRYGFVLFWCVVVGDSRCIIVQRGGRTVPLSNDHKPNRPDEMRRISALGGKVTFKNIPRVEGVLAVSRALGDMKLHPYVTCEPEFTARRLEPNDLFMVMASDGLWDVMTNEDVGRFVHKKYLTFSRDVGPTASAASPKKYYKQFVYLAKQLCEEASILGSGDNITVQVIDLSSAHES
jgi:protein phosphatase 2C